MLPQLITKQMKTSPLLVSIILLLFFNIAFSQTIVSSYQKISATEGNFTGPLLEGDCFGRSVCCIGDLNNDGVNDIAVGASRDDDGGIDKGAIWILFMNSDATVKSHQKISELEGGFSASLTTGGVFGSGIDTVGDLNGDGVVDLVVGAEYDSDGGGWHGAIWILFMNTDGTVKNQQKISDTQGGFNVVFSGSCAFGSGVEPIGDFNGDNVLDLIVGMRRDGDGGTRRGAVFIICLNTNGTVKSYHKISNIHGNFTGVLDDEDHFGCSIASLGDKDGDGVIDVAVGAFCDGDGGFEHGAVWILFLDANGDVKSHQKISSTQGGFTGILNNEDRFAHAMNSLGDYNNDGVTDIFVGAIYDGDGGYKRGAVWLVLLKTDGSVEDQYKISNTQGGFNAILDDEDLFGQAVANIGDINGDGSDDLAVGAALDDDGGLNKGAVYLFFTPKQGEDEDTSDVFCEEPYIFVPNAFSPDGDNINDILFVRGNVIEEMYIAIYNRWGEKVFESTKQENGWDGRFRGEYCQPGVFVYYLDIRCYGKKIFKKKGNITLIR